MKRLFHLAAVTTAVLITQELAMSQDPVDVLKTANSGVERFALDNGMTVLLKEDRGAPLVAIQYWVGAGSIHEDDHLGGGLSHYLEHMIFKGTPTRGPGQVSTEIADAGGDINAYTSNDRTVFHTTLPADRWQVGLDVLTDAVFHPAFPQDEWAREREVILREVDMCEDDPGRVMLRLMWETAFREHPYRIPVIGWRDILVTMSRNHLVEYHRRHYSPDNMILSVAGDVPVQEMAAAIRERLATIPRTPRTPVVIAPEPPQLAERILRQTGPYEITRLAWVFHTTNLADPDTPALDVLASAVGSGRSSPLVRRLREEDRLVHDIDAWSYTPQDPGLFGVTAELDPDQESAVMEALRDEISRWHSEPFAAARIEQARREVIVQSIQSLASMNGQAASMASGEFYAGNPRHVETYLEQVRRLTPEDLSRVARQYLRPENGSWILLTPDREPVPVPQRRDAAELDIRRIEATNGLRVIIREDARLPLVHVAAVLGGGLLVESDGQAGITRLVADLLTRGTSRHSAAELAERLESRAIDLTPFSGRNSYGLSISGLSEDLPLMLDTLAECLLDAQFPPEEIEKQRDLQLAAIRRELERPMTYAQQMVRDAFFPGHPYRFSASGTPDTVAALDRPALQAHHHKLLGTSNLVLAVFGDVQTADVQALVSNAFATLPAQAKPEWPALPPPPAEPLRTEQALPFKQTIFVRAWPGIAVGDPREDAISVLMDALSGLSSDLFIEVRDKRGLAYYTGATQFIGPVGGLFQIFAGTTEEGLDEVETQIDLQADRLRTTGPRDDEMARAIEQLLADLARARQNNGALAQQCALDELLGLGYRHSLAAADRLKHLDAEAVRGAAESLFAAPGPVTAVIRPAPAP
ncbi:MAG: pitrilysin family protein [Kiritimatiellae bacterium]|nr:pitrilysin family protein [Kiritimatiellia bacterium]